MPFDTVELRRTSWLLIGLAGLFLVVWLSPPFAVLHGADIMPLPIHVAMEVFAIVIAMLVFAITWNAYDASRATNTLILACGFLTVGLLDFGHMFSFRGMPDFVTPSGPEKGIQFWLAGRFVTALLLLTVSFRTWQPLSKPSSRYGMLLASLAVTIFVYWLVLYHGDELPQTFIDGLGLTAAKVGAEYVIIALLAVAALRLFRHSKQDSTQPFDTIYLSAACIVTILSELCFVLYSNVSDVFNLLGHVYKVIAYLLIYRAVFIDSVRYPIQKLRQAKDELRDSKNILSSILDNVPIRVFWKDRYGRYLGANNLFMQDAGLTAHEQLAGKDDFDLYPQEQAKHFQADDREVMDTCAPKLNIEESLSTADGRERWLLTNKVPLLGAHGEATGILGAYADVTVLRDAELRLEQSNEQLRDLAVRREEAREDERKRIARDLHDELGQILTVLRMDVSMLRIKFGKGDPLLDEQVKSILWRVDSTIQVVREVASKLRPSVLDLGVVSAIEWQIAEFGKRNAISCKLELDGKGVEKHLNDDQSIAIFRMVQEALTNIMRYARARHVVIRLQEEDGACMLEIRDDGDGFDPDAPRKKTLGLFGIRERALALGGELLINSKPGHGCILTVRIPYSINTGEA
ncbi:MAG: MASE3 domain-containing protein [Sideroxyarcus sp.]|nr:MASE3 domain-containing protein [Sideroxyarcus sp.]